MADLASDTIARILRRVAELPDRSSPTDWPEALMVTHEELEAILADELAWIPRWQPIETAPKDGTEIMGYCAGLRMFGLMSYEAWESAGVRQGMWATNDGGYQRSPTHWMPLPAAPKEVIRG